MVSAMRSLVFLVLVLNAVTACKDKAPEKPAATGAFPGTDGLELAPSTVATKAADPASYPNHVVAYGSTRGLTFDGRVLVPPPKDPSRGFDAKDKNGNEHELVVAPLDAALAAATRKETSLVAIAADTPYRIAAEITFTLGNFGIRKLELLVGSGAEPRVISMPLVTSALPCGETLPDIEHDRAMLEALFRDAAAPEGLAFVPLASRDPICISADAASDGVRVRSRRDRLATSCSEVAPIQEGMVPTLPSEGSLPLGEVKRCVSVLQQRFPKTVGSRVVVSARGERSWRDVVALLDAFGTPSGFGDPLLGMPK
jgi:hypothetical protein